MKPLDPGLHPSALAHPALFTLTQGQAAPQPPRRPAAAALREILDHSQSPRTRPFPPGRGSGARARARVSPVWGELPLGRAAHVMRRALPARPERGCARAPDPRARARAPSPPPVEPAPGPPGQFPRARSGGGARVVRARGGARAARGRADSPSPGTLLPAAAAARARAWRLPRATLSPGAGSGLRPPLAPRGNGTPELGGVTPSPRPRFWGRETPPPRVPLPQGPAGCRVLPPIPWLSFLLRTVWGDLVSSAPARHNPTGFPAS